MNLRLALHSGAQTDVAQAANWYEEQQPELGNEFLDELDHLLTRMAENPMQFPEVESGVRRGLLRRFPFGVYFVRNRNRVEVIAVLHLHRNPRTWRGRM